jgi:hypothetical protein
MLLKFDMRDLCVTLVSHYIFQPYRLTRKPTLNKLFHVHVSCKPLLIFYFNSMLFISMLLNFFPLIYPKQFVFFRTPCINLPHVGLTNRKVCSWECCVRW